MKEFELPPECGEAISELRTLGSLIDVLSEHGDRQAVLALQEEGAESWSYSELAGYARRLTAKATNPKTRIVQALHEHVAETMSARS